MVLFEVMNNGPGLFRAEKLELIKSITRDEVLNATRDINDSKSPDNDGYNVLFFKKVMSII